MLRYSFKRKARYLGLGSARDLTLSKARQERDRQRVRIRDGVDPVAEREAVRQARKAKTAEAGGPKTFRDAAEACIENKKSSWSNEKHTMQWSSTLQRFAYPVIGNLNVSAVDRAQVIKVLTPIWLEKKETANRLRGRIEDVIAFAMSRGWRPESAGNPAERSKLLLLGLPQRKSKTQEHFASLHYSEIRDCMTKLQGSEGLAARALEFLILTAARPGQAICTRRPEINVANATWTVPAERMKKRVEFCVPLSRQALELLEEIPELDDLVFVSPQGGQYSDAAMAAVLNRIGYGHVTPHGFRATFKTWADDLTDFETETKEHALAHGIKDKTEAAYSRSSRFQKRSALMQEWGDYCREPSAAVLNMRRTIGGWRRRK